MIMHIMNQLYFPLERGGNNLRIIFGDTLPGDLV
jgi:hypothetical protein